MIQDEGWTEPAGSLTPTPAEQAEVEKQMRAAVRADPQGAAEVLGLPPLTKAQMALWQARRLWEQRVLSEITVRCGIPSWMLR